MNWKTIPTSLCIHLGHHPSIGKGSQSRCREQEEEQVVMVANHGSQRQGLEREQSWTVFARAVGVHRARRWLSRDRATGPPFKDKTQPPFCFLSLADMVISLEASLNSVTVRVQRHLGTITTEYLFLSPSDLANNLDGKLVIVTPPSSIELKSHPVPTRPARKAGYPWRTCHLHGSSTSTRTCHPSASPSFRLVVVE